MGISVSPKLLDGLQLTGFEDHNTKRLAVAHHLLRKGKVASLKPLLPLLLNLKGEPYSLENYFPFEPFFRTRMPRRFLLKTGRQVSKSTSLASRGVVQANCLPSLSTLYISPLFEMIRRFSQNYVRPFIEQSPVSNVFTGTNTIGSVLQRTFRNKSQMIFSFAFMDAERTRGISADQTVYDESCRVGIIIETASGPKRIEDLRVGDIALSFDELGNKVWRPVKNVWYHGRRRCYRVHTARGGYVDCTADTWIPTDAGWLRLSQIIQAARTSKDVASPDSSESEKAQHDNPGTATNASGNATGRRTRNTEGRIPSRPRIKTEGVPLAQTSRIVRVRSRKSFLEHEEQVRNAVGNLLDCSDIDICVFEDPMLSRRYQDCNAGMVMQDRQCGISAGSSLVDMRRRLAGGTTSFAKSVYLHSRLPIRRGRTFVSMDDGSWVPVVDIHAQSERVPTLPGNANACQRFGKADAGYSPVHSANDALQSQHDSTGQKEMSVLRQTVCPGPITRPRRSSKLLLLQQALVPDETAELAQQKGLGEEQRENQKGTTNQESRRRPGRGGETSCVCATSSEEEPRHVQETQEEVQPETQRRARPGSDHLPDVQEERRSWSAQENRQVLLRQLQTGTSEANSQAPLLQETGDGSTDEPSTETSKDENDAASRKNKLSWTRITHIEDVGIDDVVDVEIEGTHSFVANGLGWGQCQDLDKDFIPIIRETMSGSKWGGIETFAGTPKSLENTIEMLWRDSSMAEWVIKCHRCNYYNVPAMSHHLEKMIGPYRKTTSVDSPAVICAKCRKPIHPKHHGRWVHGRPSKVDDKGRKVNLRWEFAGYHVPQIIMPMHYGNPEKWDILLGKLAGRGNTPIHVFWNEVCGESYDTGAKIVTLTELMGAACLPWRNDEHEAKKHIGDYTMRILAVDWGGGGEKGVSFTTFAVMGMMPNGQVDVLHGFRSLTPHDHAREAQMCLHLIREFKCDLMTHDYTGAGSLRETFVAQAGFPLDRIIACQLQRAAAGGILQAKPATPRHPRDYYMVDKPRSLLLTCNQIKTRKIRFFQDDFVNSEQPGLIRDFLALVEEKVDSRLGKDIYTITRDPALIDDFAQAVNLGYIILCQAADKWPDVSSVQGIAIDRALIDALSPEDPDWN